MKVIVVDVNAYSFPDKQDAGRMIEGCKVQVIMEGSEGYSVAKLSAPYALRDKCPEVPGLYEAVTDVSMSGDKAVMRIADLQFVNSVNFGGLFAPNVKGEKVPA